MKMINFVLFLWFIFSPIVSKTINDIDIEIIKFNGTYFSEIFTTSEPKYFEIVYESEELEPDKYLKIELVGLNNTDNPNLVIAFSNDDKNCLEREQLSYGLGNTQMWLTKEQILNKNKYINLICSSKSCNYKLNIEAHSEIDMDYNSQFNLYVTENNKKVEISFSSGEEIDESDYVTIWAIGNKKVSVSSDDIEEIYKYSKNNIFKIYKREMNKSIFSLTITGEVGDVINIGSSTIFTNDYRGLLVNKPEIKGYLQKNYSNEDCYELSKDNSYISLYLTGIIHSKIAEIYYKNNNGEVVSDSINIIKNGSFIETITPDSKYRDYICIRFPTSEKENYDITEIFYSLQLTDPSQTQYKIGLYSPQLYGELYPRRLLVGKEYSYIGVPPNDSSKQISIDMISQFEFPDMFYRLCKNYPICDEFEGEIDARCINGHSTHKIKYEYKSPMDPNQHIIFVKCLGNKAGESCSFKTSFNSDIDKINLKEDEPFSQYILKGEKDLYKIDYSGEKKVKRIYIDLILFTGDVNFNTDSNLKTKKIYNSNKIFYIIDISEETSENKEIDFNVLASKNSYYTIEYMFIRENDDSWITNIIEPGLSYLVTIDPNAEDSDGNEKPLKIVKFTNPRNSDYKQILAQFYSLNCKLNVTSKRIDEEGKTYYKEISAFDQYYQDIVDKNVINDYEYMLYVTETDSSNYNNKLCMVYSSSLELGYEKKLDERQLVISDNEPKQMTFSNINIFEYLYPLSNSANDVIINFNFLDLGIYDVTITFPNGKPQKYTQTGNDLIYLHRNEWKNLCKANEICPITIKIELIRYYQEKAPKLLISVKSVQESSPTYLTKNQAKLDFLLGENWQYYYTDLGENEEGDVLVSYRRGSGRLFGKIVSKNAEVPEDDASWREMYKFPTTVNESLEFYGYIKKILIKKNETENCKDGCYLLLSLKTSIESQEPQPYFREHPFSIIIHTRSSNEIKDIPIINIPLREYIIGNLYTHEDNNIYEYYSTIFTHNSKKISIDFQSKVVNFYINVGVNNKPTRDSEPDFKYESNGQDTIYEITRDEFLKKCKEKKINIPNENSLLGLGITIGLWTNKTDSLYTTVYSMKIHLPFDDKLDIYEVKSDQKTLCKTQRFNNINRCLFIVFYTGIDPINNLLLYPLIQNHSPYDIYAHFIMQEKYEFYDSSYLNSEIPSASNSEYLTRNTSLDYIYIPHGFKYDYFLFVNIITREPTTVELLTTFYNYDLQLSPNPSSPQLFIVKNDHFLFEFPTSEDLIINIQLVCGEGNIYWEVDNSTQYSLRGKNQLISLTNSLIDKSDETKVFSNLYIKNKNENSKSQTCPGFGFYIDYLLRPSKVNLDEIKVGFSNEIAYRNTDFPVYIYAQLKNIGNDTNLFVNLYELIGDSYSDFTTITPFEISGDLITDSDLMTAKLNPEFLNNLQFDIKGTYDSMIKTGFVLIKKTDIENKKMNLSDGVNAIIRVSKNIEYKEMKNFTSISLEASANQEYSEIPVTPEIYQYGKLNLNSDKNIYKLRTDKAGKYMRIHYSPNSQNTRFSITTIPGQKENASFKEYSSRFVDGKTVITFDSNPQVNNFIYLNIFHNEKNKASTDKTTNYVFKYMNSDNTKNFKLYELSSNEGFQLEQKKNGNNYDYTFTITPLPYSNINVTYFIKFVKKSDWINGESDNCIALRESKSYVEELNNVEIKNKKIVKKYEKISEIDYRYVQIIAQVKDNGLVEFVGYKSIYIKDSIVWKIVLIIVAAIIVFIVVLCLIRIYLKKKRNIEGKVAKIEGAMVSRISDAPSIE